MMNSIANSNAGNNNNNNNNIISKATELSVTSSPKFQTSIQTAYATRSKSADVKHEDKYGNTFATDTLPQNDDVDMTNVNVDLEGEVLVKENQVLISSESDTSKIKLINFYTPIEGGAELIQTERSIALKLIPLTNDLNNNYVSSSVTELSTGKKFETELVHQDFHPTTTVNLSESNQSVYFMMQTTPIDLITTAPNHQTKQATSNHVSTLNNKLFTSLTSKEPTSVAQTVNAVSSSSTPTSSSSNKVVRDERRRANHNEVERRRRDNINKWIVELSKVIPDCSNDQSKHGQSKGGILEKTVQHLNDLNQALNGHAQSLHLLKQENQLLKEQNEAFKKENQFLKSKLGLRDSYPDSMTQLNGLDTSATSNSNGVSNSSSSL